MFACVVDVCKSLRLVSIVTHHACGIEVIWQEAVPMSNHWKLSTFTIKIRAIILDHFITISYCGKSSRDLFFLLSPLGIPGLFTGKKERKSFKSHSPGTRRQQTLCWEHHCGGGSRALSPI